MLRPVTLTVVRIRPHNMASSFMQTLPIEISFVGKPTPSIILDAFNELNGPNTPDFDPDVDLEPYRQAILLEQYHARETVAYNIDHYPGQ